MSHIIRELISDVYYSSHLIEKRIDQTLLKTFPTTTALNLLKSLKKICKYSRESLFGYLDHYNLAPGQTTTHIRLIYYFLRFELASHIRFAEGASIDKTPASFVRALENLVSSLGLLENSVFIIRPQWHYNFKIFELREYYESFLKNILKESQVNEIFQEFGDKRIYIISFPGFQRNNLQILTALGHEIGHPIAKKYLDNESDDYKYGIENDVQEKFSEKWKDQPEDKREREKGELIDKIISLREGFIEEVISDLVSCYIFNLSAIFEIERLIQSLSNIDEPDIDLDSSHPAWRTRLRITFNDLVRGLKNWLDFRFYNFHRFFRKSKVIISAIYP